METKTVIAVLIGLNIVLFGLLFKEQLEVQHLSQVNVLSEKQISLLKDQVQDYVFKIETSRTYEEGVKDTLLRAGGSYNDGFQAARSMYENSSYTEGYHNAIAQFGYQVPKNSNVYGKNVLVGNDDGSSSLEGK